MKQVSGGAFRHLIRRSVATAVLVGFVSASVFAVDGKKAMYVGGTRTDIKETAEGIFDVTSETEAAFTPDKTHIRHTIPYSEVQDLEYGQHAGRRVAVALLVSPIAIFSKKRRHYLTINFKDKDGKEQAVVFELGKDIVRTTLSIMEARTGKKVQFEDEEARKSGKGGL